jgi:hypothetical protein
MSNGPDPAMVNDWFTWPFVFGCVFLVFLVWLTLVILLPRERIVSRAVEPAPIPVSPCAPHGHRYVAQPVTWRCATCGDERTPEGVYDQSAA